MLDVHVQNSLSMKHFHGVSSGSPHAYLLKSCIGKVRKFSSRIGSLTFEEKKQVVRLLVDEVLVDSINEKLIVKHVIPLDKRFPLRSGSGESFLGV